MSDVQYLYLGFIIVLWDVLLMVRLGQIEKLLEAKDKP